MAQSGLFRDKSHFAVACEFIEIQVYTVIYKNALQPRGEVDNQRDEIFQKHLVELSEQIVLGQGDCLVKIKDKYLTGAPWRPAILVGLGVEN